MSGKRPQETTQGHKPRSMSLFKASDFGSKKAVAVIFFCNGCPYSTFYLSRIKVLFNTYSDTQFLLVNSSNSDFEPEESTNKMGSLLNENELNMPYLVDKDKIALGAFRAKKCPEVFVLTAKDWKVVYQGAIDNNPQVEADVSEYYLKDVLNTKVLLITPS